MSTQSEREQTQHYAHSDWVIYADESGDPSTKISGHYPIFVLSFCVFKRETYLRHIVPAVQRLKFHFWGHDMINLRSYNIRQREEEFTFLRDEEKRSDFMGQLSEIIQSSRFVIISSAIRKELYIKPGQTRRDIYDVALQFCMERLNDFLRQKRQDSRIANIIAEGRGKKEDRILKEDFGRILMNQHDYHQTHRRNYRKTPMEIRFAAKAANSTGMQIADLVGYAIGRHVLNPKNPNPSYEAIEDKIFRGGGRMIGLKVFP